MSKIRQQLKQLSTDTIYYGLGGAISKFIAFFKAPILTRIFVPGDYGYIDLLGTTLSFFLMLVGLNMVSGVYRYYYEYKDETDKKILLSTGFIFVLFTCIVLTILLFIFKPFLIDYIASNSREVRNNSLFLSLVILRTPFNLIQSYFLSIFRLQRKAKLYLYINIFSVILNFVVTMVLVVGLKMHLLGAFLSNLVSVFIICALTIVLIKKEIIFAFSTKMFKEIMRYSLPSYPVIFVNWGLSQMNKLMIYDFSTETELGYYTIALKIVSIMSILGYAYRSAWGPFSMQLIQQENHKQVFNEFFRYGVILFSLAAFSISIFSKPIVMILAPPSYYKAIIFIPFLLFAVAFDISHHTLAVGISISKKTEYMTYAQTITFFFAVILNWILINKYMALGAALALIPVYMCKYIAGYLFSLKVYKIKFNFKIEYLFFMLLFVSVVYSYLSFDIKLVHSIFYAVILEVFAIALIFIAVLKKNERDTIMNFISNLKANNAK